jgi:hypothetical protein
MNLHGQIHVGQHMQSFVYFYWIEDLLYVKKNYLFYKSINTEICYISICKFSKLVHFYLCSSLKYKLTVIKNKPCQK